MPDTDSNPPSPLDSLTETLPSLEDVAELEDRVAELEALLEFSPEVPANVRRSVTYVISVARNLAARTRRMLGG